MGRVLGIDLGGRRIGIAISDPLGRIARPLDSIVDAGEGDLVGRIGDLCREHEVGRVVVGLPLNMDGTRGPQAEAATEFAGRLGEALGLPVVTWDERLTSVQADRILAERKVRGKERKRLQDRLAAQIILQGYLDSLPPGGP